MPWLQDLILLAQDYTWVMVVGIWITAIVGMRYLHREIASTAEEIHEVRERQSEMQEDLVRADAKQDHIVSRQEMVLERMGMNQQEIQDLQEETTRLHERHNEEERFWRGSKDGDD